MSNALPPGYALHEYRIESVLGVGGFGLTYLATDANLSLKVALKEYLPADFAARREDSTVQPRSDAASESFQWGLQRFMNEARTLASFRHPNIVRVMRFFEANNTGYMVMEFVEGKPLPEWILARRPLPQPTLLALATSLLDGLAVIHRSGFLHRDIKPANIYIREDNSPVLLDFGSARQLRGGNQELTAVVSPGYAPLEQYHSHGRQGPWSDLYAFGGVLYWLVTGRKPVEAAARVKEDVLPPAAKVAAALVYTPEFLAAIDWALMPDENARPQSVADFKHALLGSARSVAAERTVRIDAADVPTVKAKPVDSDGMIGLAGVTLDLEQVRRVETELAHRCGSIAIFLTRNAAKKAVSIQALAEAVAGEIEDEQERAAFVRKFTVGDTLRLPSGVIQSGVRQGDSISRKFTSEILQNAEAELAQYIGEFARIVVKHAAAKARDEAELYLLIADEIKDSAERKAFVRKAFSFSGKRS